MHSRRWSRQAAAIVVSASAETTAPGRCWATMAASSVATRYRSRGGRTCSSFARTRIDVSSIPATVPLAAVRNPTATATASSSSSSSGGMAAPAPSRYPPTFPIVACTG